MPSKQSNSRKGTVERVMHEFKTGELKSGGRGPKVKNPKQAIAIALHEAGASNRESPAENRSAKRKTKAKESKGETAQAETEGKRAQDRTLAKGAQPKSSSKTSAKGEDSRSKAALYAEARKRDVPGRSKMTKTQLQRSLQN